MNNLNFKRQQRKSMLGTRSRESRLTAMKTDVPLIPETRRITRSVFQERLLLPNKLEIPTIKSENMTKQTEEPESKPETKVENSNPMDKVLDTVNLLLEKNAQTLKSQLQEREELKNIKQILCTKLNLDDTFSDYELDNQKEVSEDIVPKNDIIQEMRSTLKFLKTPRQSRTTRKSVLLTPHSMSFCIQKQMEELLE